MSTYVIKHVVYGDICGDSYYGKDYKTSVCYTVACDLDTIKDIVNKLNKLNKSYYGKDEPEDEFDRDYVDEDYFTFEEVAVDTPDEVIAKIRERYKYRSELNEIF